jgi:hypothetical protein
VPRSCTTTLNSCHLELCAFIPCIACNQSRVSTKELLGRLAAEDCFQVGVKFQRLTCAYDNIGQVRVQCGGVADGNFCVGRFAGADAVEKVSSVPVVILVIVVFKGELVLTVIDR